MGTVATSAPAFVAAAAVPDVPRALEIVVGMASEVAGAAPWAAEALTLLMRGNLTGATAVLSPLLADAMQLLTPLLEAASGPLQVRTSAPRTPTPFLAPLATALCTTPGSRRPPARCKTASAIDLPTLP